MNILKNKIKRRDVIRNMAKAGVLLPFASQFLVGGRAHAAPVGTANRLIVVYYPNGANLEEWHTDDINNLSFAMRPLEPYSQSLVDLHNLTVSGAGGSTSQPDAAQGILSGGIRGGATIDAAIGNTLNANRVADTVHLGLYSNFAPTLQHMPFRDINGNTEIPIDDPNQVVNVLFAGFPAQDQSSDTALRLQILESMEEDFVQLRNQALGSSQTTKLDAYEESLTRFRSLLNSNLNPADLTHNVQVTGNARTDNPIAEDICIAQMQNLAVAMEADYSRVSAFQFMSAVDDSLLINFESLEPYLRAVGFWEDGRRFFNENRSLPASRFGNGIIEIQNMWYNMMVAELCRQLSNRQDPLGGGSLFDTSLILMCTEIGQSTSIGQDNMPWYLLGGANGALNSGQVFDCSGRNSADLLLEIARMMGLNWNAFGNSNGGIPGLRTS